MNTMFPGRPYYVGPISGMFGLLHHENLCEYSHDVMERVKYVKENKPPNEVDVRLRNMIYLGCCAAVAKRKSLYDDYAAKIKPLDAEILAYIKTHIPDCAWNGKELEFK